MNKTQAYKPQQNLPTPKNEQTMALKRISIKNGTPRILKPLDFGMFESQPIISPYSGKPRTAKNLYRKKNHEELKDRYERIRSPGMVRIGSTCRIDLKK